MNSGSPRSSWSVRVYTIVLLSTLSLAITASAAPMRITVEPAMTKGPARVPVTIFEFSDYQ